MLLLRLALMGALVHGWGWRSRVALGPYPPPEAVFGIELTLEGAVVAVSRPNGSFDGFTSASGSPEYIDLMGSLYKLLLTRNRTAVEQEYPSPDSCVALNRPKLRNWILKKIASWLGLPENNISSLFFVEDCFINDTATGVLEEFFKEIRNATARLVEEAEFELGSDRPFVELALPAWFFRTVKVFDKLEDVADMDPKYINATDVHAKQYYQLLRRISTAISRSGFRRSAELDEEGMFYDKGERLPGPMSGPQAALTPALHGSCAGKPSILDQSLIDRGGASNRSAIAIRADITGDNTIITGWVSNMEAYPFRRADWKVWRLCGNTVSTNAWMQDIAAELLDMVANMTTNKQQASYLLLGRAWSPELKVALEQAMLQHPRISYQLPSPENGTFLAALEAAVEARMLLWSHSTCTAGFEWPWEPEENQTDRDSEL